MAEAHNHHFVPQGYLRAFADGVGRQARILAFDRYEGKAFRTKVRNVGASRDFNRVEVEGMDPNTLEKNFAEFEGPATDALRRIQELGSFAVNEDRSLVLNLVALLAARNPRFRRQQGEFISRLARRMNHLMVSSKSTWNSIERRRRKAAGEPEVDDSGITYESMKEFVQSNRYTIEADQTYQISVEMDMIDPILETLAPRKWKLLVAADRAGDFITSDHPVCLLDISGNPPGPYGIGFGMTKTAVLFPVSRKLLLSGTFEGPEGVDVIGPIHVAQLNSQIVQRADRQVYAFDDSFKYFRPNGLAKGTGLAADPLFHRAKKPHVEQDRE